MFLQKWQFERKLKRKLIDFLKDMEIGNVIEIKKVKDNTGFTYYDIAADGGRHFEAFRPVNSKDVLTLKIACHQKTLDTGIDATYIEAFIFKIDGFVPYKFVIRQDPQTQITYLTDGDSHKKGCILYSNWCVWSLGGESMEIERPFFTSEMVNLSKLLD